MLCQQLIECVKCGGLTNTAVSNWIHPQIREDKKAYECYAKAVNGKWVKGCSYDNCNPYNKSYIDKLIGTLTNPKIEKPSNLECDEKDE